MVGNATSPVWIVAQSRNARRTRLFVVFLLCIVCTDHETFGVCREVGLEELMDVA
jgi:hypothetical protein